MGLKSRLPGWAGIWVKAGQNWNADGAFKNSAAVSFYTLFSLAPITIIALSIAGFFFGHEEATQQFSTQMTQLVGKASAETIRKAVASTELQRADWASTAISVGVLLVGATTVFGQLQESLNAIWGVRAKPSRSGWTVFLMKRLISFAMVLTVGFLLLISLVLTTALSAFARSMGDRASVAPSLLRVADLAVALVVITVLFALIFKFMPDVEMRWREVWRGAFLAAFLFSVGRLLIALYLSHTHVASVYGTGGSVVALLIWVYYSCAILFYGAEFTRAYGEEHGLPVLPKNTAVLVRQEIVSAPPGTPASPQ